MTSDEVSSVSRRHRSRRTWSRKSRRARDARRISKALGWGLLALVTTGIFMTAVIYLVLSMRGEGD